MEQPQKIDKTKRFVKDCMELLKDKNFTDYIGKMSMGSPAKLDFKRGKREIKRICRAYGRLMKEHSL